MKHGLKEKLIKTYMLFFILPVLVLGFMYVHHTTGNIKKKYISEYSNELLNQTKTYNDFLIATNEKLNFCCTYMLFQEYVDDYESYSFSEIINKTFEIRDILNALLRDKYDVKIALYVERRDIYNNLYIKNIKELEEQSYFTELQNIGLNQTYYTLKEEYGKKLGIYRKVVTSAGNSIFIEVSVKSTELLTDVMKKDTNNDMKMIILSSNGRMYSVSDKISELTDIGSIVKKENKYYVLKNPVSCNNSMIIKYISKKESLFDCIKVYVLFIAIVLFAAIFSYCISTYVANKMTGKINKVVCDMKDIVKNGVNNIQVDYDEFDIISETFTQLVGKLEDDARKEIQLNRELKEKEIIVLQERMSPHFLYNALGAIKMIYPEEKLNNVIDSLINYYRISLNNGKEIIKICDELNGVKEYLKVQRFAYGRYFEIIINCATELKECTIMKNTIQPLAENAFFHGVNRLKTDTGIISISVTSDENDLTICVYDNGPKIKKEALKRIKNMEESDNDKNGYALRNLQKRLNLVYNEKARLSINETDGVEFVVRIPIDAVRREGHV